MSGKAPLGWGDKAEAARSVCRVVHEIRPSDHLKWERGKSRVSIGTGLIRSLGTISRSHIPFETVGDEVPNRQ